jgi:hypothetical protein
MNFKVSQLKSLTAGEVAVDDLIYVIDSNPTDGSVKSKKVTVGDLIDSRIYGISSSQFVLITGYYADPSWITSLDWSKITNAPSFVTSLSALTDVQLSTPLSGQALVYNGTKWVNQGIGELDTLDSVTTRGNTTTNSITVGDVTSTGVIKSVVNSVTAQFTAYNPTNNFPRAQFQIGQSASDNNTGLTIAPLFSSTGVQKPAFIQVSTNKNVSDSGQFSGYLIVNTNLFTIGTTKQDGQTSGGVPIVFAPAVVEAMRIQNNGNIQIGTTTDAGYKLRVNGTVSAQLTNATHASQVYYNTSTGELTYGAAPVPTTPTLDQVTTAGNTTTNAITVGLINSTALRAVVTITDTTAEVNNPSYFGSYDNFLQLSVNRNPSTGVYAQTGKASSQISLEGDAGTSSIRFYTTTTNNSIPSERMRIFGGGNITIGNNVDAGYKLDVNGNARVTGVASLSSIASQTTIVDGAVFNADTTSFNIIGGRGNNQAGILNLTSTVGSFTPNFGGVKNMLNIGGNFTVGTSAAGDVNFLNINPTINYPVGSSGTQRGIYINPTLTRVTNYKAIEVAQGVIVTTSPITAASALAQGVYFNNTLVAAANNDVLVGLDINPTFTNGAFTGVSNFAARFGGNVIFTEGAKTISIAAPAATGNGGALTISAGNATTAGQGGNISIQPGNGAGGPGAGTVIISNTSWWNGATVNGTLTVTNGGPNTGTSLQVNAGGQNGLTIYWDNLTPFMQYGLVSARQARFVNSSSYSFSNNLLVGTTTDAGFKLDVSGTGRFSSYLYVGGGSGSGLATSSTNTSLVIWNRTVTASGDGILLGNGFNSLGGSNINLNLVRVPVGTTYGGGTNTTNVIYITPTINNSGGTNILRGIYYEPTLTSLTGTTHRAIETTSGDVIFNGGNVGIGTATPTSKLFIYTDNTSSTIGDNNAFIIHNNNPNWATSGAGNLTELFFSDAGQGSGTTNGLNLNHRYAGISAFLTGWNGLSSAGGLNFITKENTASTLSIKLQIKPNGNVLIGTTTDASYKLDVNGTARVNNIFYVTNSAYTGNLRIEAFANNQQRIIGANGENITFGAAGNTMHLNATETYFSGSLLGGGFWMQSNGNTVIGAQSTPPASALVEIRSTTKGFLKPRLTTTEKSAITTPATGLEVYDSTTNTPNYFNGTTWVGVASNQSTGLSPGLFSQTSDSVAVTNTTVESSLISTGVGTLSVPANGFQVGAAYIAYLSGVMSSQNNATMEIHLRSNGFVLADTNPMILSATTGKFWELHVNFVIRAIGGGGVAAIVTSGRFSYNKDSGNTPESLGFSDVNNTTFDTTINNTLAVTATWGNASPLNSIQTRIFNLYRVY